MPSPDWFFANPSIVRQFCADLSDWIRDENPEIQTAKQFREKLKGILEVYDKYPDFNNYKTYAIYHPTMHSYLLRSLGEQERERRQLGIYW